MVLSVVPSEPASGASTTTTSLPTAIDLASIQSDNGGFHADEPLGPGLHQNAGDLAAGRRDHTVRVEQAARDEGPAVYF